MKSIIQDKHGQLEEMRERAEYLETENKRLMQEIKDTDKKMDTDSRNLLEKHEKFMSNLHRLKQGYECEVAVARDVSEKAIQNLHRELDALEAKIEDEVTLFNSLCLYTCSTKYTIPVSFVDTVEPVNNEKWPL